MKNKRNEQMTIENVTEGEIVGEVTKELEAPLGLKTNITLLLATADRGPVAVHMGLSGEQWSCVPPITDAEMVAMKAVSIANRLVYNVNQNLFFYLNEGEWEKIQPMLVEAPKVDLPDNDLKVPESFAGSTASTVIGRRNEPWEIVGEVLPGEPALTGYAEYSIGAKLEVSPGEVIDILQDILTTAEEIEKVIDGD